MSDSIRWGESRIEGGLLRQDSRRVLQSLLEGVAGSGDEGSSSQQGIDRSGRPVRMAAWVDLRAANAVTHV